ncbi:MAG: methyltransferase type 11 [Treponema sp.]|nr:methyltransferase type 11 [Treponema sp.]
MIKKYLDKINFIEDATRESCERLRQIEKKSKELKESIANPKIMNNNDLFAIYADNNLKEQCMEELSCQYSAIPKTEWKDINNRIDLPRPYSCTSMICNQEFLDSPISQYWNKKMKEGLPAYHRKRWELVYICQSLWERGYLEDGKKGIVFGVGEEHLPDLFASFGCHILATDLNLNESAAKGWIDTNQNAAGDLEKLRHKKICDRQTFYSRVTYRDVNMNDIPNDITGYDFCCSTCALEHLGSLRHGMDFIKNSLNTLKPGGTAVHTTEYNLYSNEDTLETEGLSLYRRKDIEQLIKELSDEGHYVYPMDWHLGTGIVDHFIDLPPYDRKTMHLRLAIDRFPCTSIGLIIRKRQS